MLGSLILYLKGLRIMVFQLSGFYCICMDPNTPRIQRFSGPTVQLLLLLLLYRHVDVRGFAAGSTVWSLNLYINRKSTHAIVKTTKGIGTNMLQ